MDSSDENDDDKEQNKRKKPEWQRRSPVQILVLAIMASVLTMAQGYYKSEKEYSLAMLRQIEAQDLWSLYAAKDIKGELSRLHQDSLTRERLGLAPGDRRLSRYLDFQSVSAGERVGQLAREKNQLYFQAKEAEYARDHHIGRAQDNIATNKRMGAAILFFQVSIMLLSVGTLVENISYYRMGNATALIALVLVVNSYLPFLGLYR